WPSWSTRSVRCLSVKAVRPRTTASTRGRGQAAAPAHDGALRGAARRRGAVPSGQCAMPVALREHRVLRRDLGGYTGPFVVTAARLDELIAAGGPAVPLSLIAAAVELPAALARGVDVVAVEVPPVADAASAAAAVAV